MVGFGSRRFFFQAGNPGASGTRRNAVVRTGSLCLCLSKVSGRAAFYLVIRFVLCGGHAFLFVSGAGAYPFGKLAGMVGFYCFLGVGHLRLCGRDVAWQA